MLRRPLAVGPNLYAQQPNFGEVGDLLVRFLNLSDGKNGIEEILSKLLELGYHSSEVMDVIASALRRGLLIESPSSELGSFEDGELERYREQVLAFDAFRPSPASPFCDLPTFGLMAQHKLKQSVVAIVGSGLPFRALLQNLALAGIGNIYSAVTADEESRITRAESFSTTITEVQLRSLFEDNWPTSECPKPDLMIYASQEFDESFCLRLNQECVRREWAFLPYRAGEMVTEVGPLVLPRAVACYRCFTLRRDGAAYERPAPSTNHSFEFPIGIEFLSIEAIKFLTHISEAATLGRVWRSNIYSGTSK
ncbi:MAG: hypothetical protein ACRDF4_08315, partial [Rhabdochlamydiaceae bacterium]